MRCHGRSHRFDAWLGCKFSAWVQKVSTHAAVASGPSSWRSLVQQCVLTFNDGVVCQHSVSTQAVCMRSRNTTVCMCAFVKRFASCLLCVCCRTPVRSPTPPRAPEPVQQQAPQPFMQPAAVPQAPAVSSECLCCDMHTSTVTLGSCVTSSSLMPTSASFCAGKQLPTQPAD